MAHTLTNLLAHIIFSTKDRVSSIKTGIATDLHAYIGGIAREAHATALVVNGTTDHVHVLARLSAALAVADFVRLIKSNSSKWLHETHANQRLFGWQNGYAAFSVSESNTHSVIRYIAEQERHHQHMTFQEELLQYLKKNNIEYDERFIWE
jgi:REP-associated tyrosine transposase